MSVLKDKTLILNAIKSHYGFKSNAALARFLGIKPNSLANWYARNTLDYELIYTKCEGINANWMLTGEGEMFIGNTNQNFTASINDHGSKEFTEGYWRGRYDELLEKHKELIQEVSHIKSNPTAPSDPNASGMA